MLTNTYECLAIILRPLRLVANCIRKPIRLIFATFWRICREYIFLHSQGYSPQCESSITGPTTTTDATVSWKKPSNDNFVWTIISHYDCVPSDLCCYVWSRKAGQNHNEINRRTTQVGEIYKKAQERRSH